MLLVQHVTHAGSSVHPPFWDCVGGEKFVAGYLSQRAVMDFASVSSFKIAVIIVETGGEVSE